MARKQRMTPEQIAKAQKIERVSEAVIKAEMERTGESRETVIARNRAAFEAATAVFRAVDALDYAIACVDASALPDKAFVGIRLSLAVNALVAGVHTDAELSPLSVLKIADTLRENGNLSTVAGRAKAASA